ncbi:MAG: hypothetical protein ACRYG4_08195, partial [Janthinobacterium lividum]
QICLREASRPKVGARIASGKLSERPVVAARTDRIAQGGTIMSEERPLASGATPQNSEHREGHDAEHKPALKRDPADKDAKLDIELDESFPSSDPPSNTQPGRGSDPAPSSGFKGS